MYKQIVVMDASKFSMKHFSSNFRSTIKAVIGKEQHIFPEALEHLYVINAPWTFRSIWTILGAFIDPITYKKVNTNSFCFSFYLCFVLIVVACVFCMQCRDFSKHATFFFKLLLHGSNH